MDDNVRYFMAYPEREAMPEGYDFLWTVLVSEKKFDRLDSTLSYPPRFSDVASQLTRAFKLDYQFGHVNEKDTQDLYRSYLANEKRFYCFSNLLLLGLNRKWSYQFVLIVMRLWEAWDRAGDDPGESVSRDQLERFETLFERDPEALKAMVEYIELLPPDSLSNRLIWTGVAVFVGWFTLLAVVLKSIPTTIGIALAIGITGSIIAMLLSRQLRRFGQEAYRNWKYKRHVAACLKFAVLITLLSTMWGYDLLKRLS